VLKNPRSGFFFGAYYLQIGYIHWNDQTGKSDLQDRRTRRIDLGPAANGKKTGGAPSNFAHISALLGDKAVIASRVGNDQLGIEALTELREKGIPDSTCSGILNTRQAQ